MPEYAIPAFVLANAEKRLRAGRNAPRMCVTPGCANLATHSPCTGHDACDTHRIVATVPTPDPARTLDALRAAAGLRTDQAPGYRTVLDQRAEAKGQRVSAARRAAARGDNQATYATTAPQEATQP